MFEVAADEAMFLPKGEPHAFLVQSDEVHVITVITPGGFYYAGNKMNEPAQKMAIPSEDVMTYANMDLTKTMEIFERYGVHILSPEEVIERMPEFPPAKH